MGAQSSCILYPLSPDPFRGLVEIRSQSLGRIFYDSLHTELHNYIYG